MNFLKLPIYENTANKVHSGRSRMDIVCMHGAYGTLWDNIYKDNIHIQFRNIVSTQKSIYLSVDDGSVTTIHLAAIW